MLWWQSNSLKLQNYTDSSRLLASKASEISFQSALGSISFPRDSDSATQLVLLVKIHLLKNLGNWCIIYVLPTIWQFFCEQCNWATESRMLYDLINTISSRNQTFSTFTFFVYVEKFNNEFHLGTKTIFQWLAHLQSTGLNPGRW